MFLFYFILSELLSLLILWFSASSTEMVVQETAGRFLYFYPIIHPLSLQGFLSKKCEVHYRCPWPQTLAGMDSSIEIIHVCKKKQGQTETWT